MNCLLCKKDLNQFFKNKKGRKYCSRDCEIKFKNKIEVCLNCKKEFTYLFIKSKKRTHCSYICSKNSPYRIRSDSYKLLSKEEKLNKLKMLFNKHTIKGLDSECWIWEGSFNTSGYGCLEWNGGKYISAHRASYLIHFNDLPSNLSICHKCDNPTCVNPSHLFLGTPKDNAQDRDKKGRLKTLKHDSHPMRKITMEIAKEIRELIKTNKYHLREISEKYNLSKTNILHIKHNKIWKE